MDGWPNLGLVVKVVGGVWSPAPPSLLTPPCTFSHLHIPPPLTPSSTSYLPSSSSREGRLFGIWRLILGLLFFLVLVLGLFVTLTTMYDGRYCDEPCPSSISSLVYHAFYPHISVRHNGLRPL